MDMTHFLNIRSGAQALPQTISNILLTDTDRSLGAEIPNYKKVVNIEPSSEVARELDTSTDFGPDRYTETETPISNDLLYDTEDFCNENIELLVKEVSIELETDLIWLMAQVNEDLISNKWCNNKEGYIQDIIKQKKLGWFHKQYSVYLNQQQEQDDYIKKPYEVEEGVIQCKCGSSRVFSMPVQTRSADEPTTTFAQCTNCKAKWSQNG